MKYLYVELLVVTSFRAYQGIRFARFRKHTVTTTSIFFYILCLPIRLYIVFTTLDGRLLSVARLDLFLRNSVEIKTDTINDLYVNIFTLIKMIRF